MVRQRSAKSSITGSNPVTDAKRGKIFTRLAKEIVIAAREGGGDPETNNRLRLAVAKAKSANMPKDNIERAIKRGTGELAGSELHEAMYEGYASHGIGLLIETVSDNKNRAVADVRHVLNKYGGSMGAAGSVAWQFTRKGYIVIKSEVDEDELFLVAADAGADDVQFGEVVEIYCELDSFQALQTALDEANYTVDEASVIYDPNNPASLDAEQAVQVLKLIEKLEDVDDVQNVYSTLDVTDEAIVAMGN